MPSPRPLTALIAALALALASGCGRNIDYSDPPAPGPDPVPPEAIGQAKSSLARSTSPAVPPADRDAAVAGNNAFAFELHRKLRAPGQNLMSSPYSVTTALAMTWAGAKGTTESQIASALRFGLPQARQHAALNAIDLALQDVPDCHQFGDCTDVRQFKFHVGNSAWAQKDYPFLPAYLDTLAVNYGAGVNLVDFENAAEPARLAINDWVAKATEDKIKDLLAPNAVDSFTRLVLTNAVYFKGTWLDQFDPANTAPGNFSLQTGAPVSVPMMHQTLETGAVSTAAYDAVELRYRDSNFAMLLVAPAAGGFDTFEDTLDVARLQAIDQALSRQQVVFSMPKFKFEWKDSLREPLKALGMTEPFSTQADFTGISSLGNLYISDVIHQTYVAVDEVGTEAAAATAVVIAGSGMPPPPITVSLDRPFLFAIRDLVTGQVVFLGRVVDPR